MLSPLTEKGGDVGRRVLWCDVACVWHNRLSRHSPTGAPDDRAQARTTRSHYEWGGRAPRANRGGRRIDGDRGGADFGSQPLHGQTARRSWGSINASKPARASDHAALGAGCPRLEVTGPDAD